MESSPESSDPSIKIITKEGKELTLSKKSCQLSELLKTAINDYPSETSFPLNDLDEKNGEKIVEYLSHYNGESPKEIEKPITSNEMKNLTDEWSASFIDKFSLDELSNLTVCANYMGIDSLLDLCCAKVATVCKDKSEDEIFKIFNISETFNEEEKKKIKEEKKINELNEEMKNKDNIIIEKTKEKENEIIKLKNEINIKNGEIKNIKKDLNEKKEEMYINKMNKLQKDLKKKEKEIKNRIEQNKRAKEAERKHSLEIILQKEKSARDTYNRKLKMDEQEREENERKILAKCKIYIIIY